MVNTSDISGGAARAAYRLHSALLAQDIDSHMLVRSKLTDDFRVVDQSRGIYKAISQSRSMLDRLPLMMYPNKTKTPFSSAVVPFSGIADKINSLNPDLVHLHWVNDGLLRIEELKKIKSPLIWSLHDMWAFTGGCHYDEFCGRYVNKCGACKVLRSQKDIDLSSKIYSRKQAVYSSLNDLTIIALSSWMYKSALKSSLLCENNIINLPNPIDTNRFSPVDKLLARQLLGLPRDKRLILFGAMQPTSDARKGFVELREALNSIDAADTELVIFGAGTPQYPHDFGLVTHYLGRFHDDLTLQILYSAVDVMVVPSLQENLSNAIMEALSCATPVVAFEIGGNSDLVSHMKNGYLAKPFDTKDLAAGINWVLGSPDYRALCDYARSWVMENFESTLVAKKYIQLYEKVLAK